MVVPLTSKLLFCSNIRVRKFKMDGISVTVKIKVVADPNYFVNPDFDEAYENTTLCEIDTDKMKYNPVRIRFYHLDRTTSLRKLLWHENEMVSDVRTS